MAVEDTAEVNADSILDLTKKALGYDSDYTHFDPDITMFINMAFSTLHQLGLGKSNGFSITGSEQKWSDFLGGREDLENVKTYVYLRTRLLHDPPATSFVLSAFQEEIKELTFYINITVETSIASYGNVYLISADGDFPDDAPSGAIGYDPATDTVWRKD